jgi:hypothetical protein
VSGSQERRRALDRLTADARRRRFDVVLCWRLDRLGRNLKHLITLLDELHTLGVAFAKGSTPRRPLDGFRCTSWPRSPSSKGVVWLLIRGK